MKKVSLSPRSFFIGAGVGMTLGLILMGLFVSYLIGAAKSNTPTEGVPLGGAIEQVRKGIQYDARLKTATSVYGRVVSIREGMLELSIIHTTDDVRQYSFLYDAATAFVSFANDADSTEISLSSNAILPGDSVTVFTNEAIGSVANQHAVKIIKI